MKACRLHGSGAATSASSAEIASSSVSALMPARVAFGLKGSNAYLACGPMKALPNRNRRTGFTINVTGVYNLLEAARVHGVKRFVHTSSGAVHTGYPGPPETFLTHDLYPLKANGPYALSKLLQEELARNFHGQHGLSIACVRPWGIIDAERMVTTDGHAVTGHSWGHIDRRDVASALVCALGTDSIEYECFYVMATPGGYKAVDVARTEKRLGWKPAITFDADL